MILIDDDQLIRLSWKLSARKKEVPLVIFESFHAFELCFHDYSFDTPIYIDSDLGPHEKGELLAQRLKEQGFKEIHLTTSYPHFKLSDFPWLSSIRTKIPPFSE